MTSVTRKLEFDAGHRIPDHRSQCRNLHGHRYVLEITLAGDVVDAPGTSDNGMLMDFSEIKAIAKRHIVDPWDHAFLVYRDDTAVRGFLDTLPDHKPVVLDRSEEHTSELQSLMRISYAVFCLKQKKTINIQSNT